MIYQDLNSPYIVYICFDLYQPFFVPFYSYSHSYLSFRNFLANSLLYEGPYYTLVYYEYQFYECHLKIYLMVKLK